ncbi:metallophosphoesterase [Neobacillus sp. SM06]|uniref:metallophosphoesterase n=1 Tax=Neobacillus sp. SM06 TaxID=3422492 RepID=UPI003D2A97C7
METKWTRRTFLKKAFTGLLGAVGVSSGGILYAHQIEPGLLEINRFQIHHPLIPKSFDGVTIIQFSDTHLGFQYTLSQLKKLITKMNSLKPDLVFFTGDLMDAPNQYKNRKHIAPVLAQLSAPLGKYCIYGNHDHGGYGSDLYKNIMQDAEFTLLKNEARRIQQMDGSSIYIIGIDDAMLGRPDLASAYKQVPMNMFTLLLSHAPDLADTAATYPIHWQLSGHSHGGQVKIPFFGALVIPPYARKYPEGLYSIGKSSPLKLYVNRGLGTTRLPFRFMAKPELTVFTLKSG